MFPYEIWSFNWSKIESKIVKRVNRGTPARHCARPRPYRRLNAGEPLHASFIPAILVVRAPLFSSLGREASSAIHSVPFLAPQRSCATLAPPLAAPAFAPTIHRHHAPISRALSCATSPRSSSIPPRARPCPTPAESSSDRGRHCRSPSSSASLRRAPSPGHPPLQIEPR